MSILEQQHEGFIQYYGSNGSHCAGGYRYFTIQTLQPNPNGTMTLQDYHVANAITVYSADNNYTSYSSIDLYPDGNITITASSATLNNISVWSANSILTRSYADARYAAFSTAIDGGSATTTGTGSYDGGSATTN
jgi:hypothetical protein